MPDLRANDFGCWTCVVLPRWQHVLYLVSGLLAQCSGSLQPDTRLLTILAALICTYRHPQPAGGRETSP